jgi:hypothetical protein
VRSTSTTKMCSGVEAPAGTHCFTKRAKAILPSTARNNSRYGPGARDATWRHWPEGASVPAGRPCASSTVVSVQGPPLMVIRSIAGSG